MQNNTKKFMTIVFTFRDIYDNSAKIRGIFTVYRPFER